MILSASRIKIATTRQGLIIYNDFIYETCGNYRESKINKYSMDTAEIVDTKKINDEYFAEGCIIIDEKLLILTWKEGVILEYDLRTFDFIRTIPLRSTTTTEA